MTTRQVTDKELHLWKRCNITADRGSLKMFPSDTTVKKDLNTVSYSSDHTAPLKTRACILCDMLVLHAVTNYVL